MKTRFRLVMLLVPVVLLIGLFGMSAAQNDVAPRLTATLTPSVTPGGSVDLAIFFVKFTLDPEKTCFTPDMSLGTQVNFTNTGDADAGQFTLKLTVNGQEYTHVVAGLAADSLGNYWFEGTGTSTDAVTVEIDALQEVAETDENNNVFTQQLPIPTPYVSCTATPEETLETPTAETPEGTPTATLDPNVTPTATVYPGVLLSLNSGFEDDVENDKVPDNWKLKNFTSAKRVCNKVNRPGKPDKIVAYSGNCALQIKSAGKLSQTLNAPFSAVGSDLYAALAFNAKGVTLDMFDAKVKVVYSTPPNGTINLKPEALNEGWTPNSSFLVVQIDQVSKFKLLFTAKAGFSGKLILDDFILSLQ